MNVNKVESSCFQAAENLVESPRNNNVIIPKYPDIFSLRELKTSYEIRIGPDVCFISAVI
jgi:hypothetical protein